MKYIALSLFCFLITNYTEAKVELTPFEEDYFEELNTARTDPEFYADLIEDFLKNFVSENQYLEDGFVLTTKEGKKAFQEAVKALRSQKKLPALILSEGLSLAARSHTEDHGLKGTFGHFSTDGTAPDVRVNKFGIWLKAFGENLSASRMSARSHMIQLIVDDGILSRGHRTTIFNAAFKKVGVGCGPHTVYTTMCTADFAGDFRERKAGGPILIGEF